MKMKNWMAAAAALVMVFALACGAAGAEEAAGNGMDPEFGAEIFGEYIGRISSTEDEIHYTLGTAEWGAMDPRDVDPEPCLSVLRNVKLTAADTQEPPEGEFVFLRIPDHCQIDFFLGDADKNYVRVTLFGDRDESVLLQAVMPEGVYTTVSGLVQAWAGELAVANGILPEFGEEGPELPEEGWVAESVRGAVWQDDRASLEVIPEGDGFKVLISWGSSAWECTEWTYACDYDPGTDTLTAEHVICDDVVYDEAGEETRTNVLDQDCGTVFSLNGEGRVVIRGAGDDRLEGKTFEKIQDAAGDL